MNLDALAIDVTASVNVPLYNPGNRQALRDADGKEAFISLVSLDSPDVQRVQKASIDKRLKMRGRATLTSSELEAERAEILVAATKGWFLVGLDGTALPVAFSEAVARQLYTDARFAWVREQVNEALDDRATFL